MYYNINEKKKSYEIQADIRDVPFWYHKKKGFPKMTDWGVVNFTVWNELFLSKKIYIYIYASIIWKRKKN